MVVRKGRVAVQQGLIMRKPTVFVRVEIRSTLKGAIALQSGTKVRSQRTVDVLTTITITAHLNDS